jgi:hypothetical protein
MMYNFPARMTIAHKKEKDHQIFSQRDIEGAFEAFLDVCFSHADPQEFYDWFKALIRPWLPGYLQQAIRITQQRDESRARKLAYDESTGNREKKRKHAWVDRRIPAPAQIGILPYIHYPTIEVRSASRPASAIWLMCAIALQVPPARHASDITARKGVDEVGK